MGAQAESQVQKKIPRLTNADRCLICYDRHTVTESEVGISFELRNLKDIFIKCFEIRFLPHFEDYGLIHMCTRCHEEFSKVETLYDDLKCNKSKFDAAREKLAFLIVDSVFKSNYISNYVHGNAFDAIRFLVFKAWSAKYKKQVQIKKVGSNNSSEKVNGNQPTSEGTDSKDAMQNVKKEETSASGDPPKKVAIKTTPEKRAGENRKPPKCESPVAVAPATTTTTVEQTETLPECKKDSTPPAPVQEPQVTGSEPEHTETSSSVATNASESVEAKQEKPKSDIGNPGKLSPKPTVTSTSLDISDTSGGETSQSDRKDAEKTPEISKPSPEQQEKAKSSDAPPQLRPSVPGIAFKISEPGKAYAVSADGKKIGNPGIFTNPRIIFVKKDPITGKMLQVPRPNLATVKGKLNGKDVIVRTTAPTSGQIRPQVFSADGSPVSITQILPVSTKSLNVKAPVASDATASPPVPKIVSVQSMQNQTLKPAVVPAPTTPAKAQSTPKETPQEKSSPKPQGTKSPKVVMEESPEPRSSRSGRRIKRPFESSAWASGHEMDKLVSQSLKNGRHGFHTSPTKRQKSASSASSAEVSSLGDEAPEEESEAAEEVTQD